MDQVLQSPELLTVIFGIIRQDEENSKARFASRIGHPNRKSSLVSLTRVNSTWRDLALSILWASPDVEALANIRSKRRQKYASCIRTLDFSGPKTREDPTLHTLFANLQFQRIKKLVLGHDPDFDSDYGEPNPRRFRSLAIHKDWSISTSQYFQETLEDLKLLPWDSICTKGCFVQIAERCPRLKRVVFSAIGTQLRPDDLLQFFRASGHLESIELRLGPESKSPLITGDLLLHFSKLTKLKHPIIDNKLDQPDLFWVIKKRNINPFKKLKFVEMTATSTVGPDLESLEWYMRWDKRTMAALSSLSKHCPKLACLTLKGAFELQMLNDLPAPLFPQLRELALGKDCAKEPDSSHATADC